MFTTSFFEKIMEIYFITTSYFSQIYFIITSYIKYGWLWWRIVDTDFMPYFAIWSWYTFIYGGFFYWFLCLQHGEHWPCVTRHVSKLLPFRVLIRSSLVLILLHCTYLAQNGEKRIGRLEETFSAIFATLCLTERQKNGIAGHLWPNQGGNWPFCWIWLTFCLPRVVTVPSCIHTESFLLAPRLLNLTGFQEMVHCPTCTLLFYIFYWEQNFPKTRVLSKNIEYAKTVDFIFIFVLCFEFQCQEPFIFHQKFIFLVNMSTNSEFEFDDDPFFKYSILL